MSEEFWKSKEKNITIHGDQMNVIESCIDRHTLENPEKIALVFEDEKGRQEKFRYKELEKEINKFANLLKSLNIKQDERVALFLPKCPEIYISFLGAIKAGCIAMPLFEAFQEQGLEMRLSRGDASVLVTNRELYERFEKIKNKPKSLKKILVIDSEEYKSEIKKQPEKFLAVLKDKKDTAIMIFTSSTAGTPVAGIQIPHYGLVQQHFTAEIVLDLKKEDNYLCTAHPGWVTGSIYGILAPLSIGCTTYIYTPHFDAKKWIGFLKKNKISVLYTAPTALRLLKPEIKKEDLKSIRNIFSVGEALEKSTFEFYKNLGIEINDTYWQTETGAIVIANTPKMKKKPGSIGKAIPGIVADIKNEMINIKSPWPAMMTGIYKHEQMYKNYFKDEWFKTNDMATKDKENYFFFIGRKDDIIKTSGERVSPIEIESILLKHEAVKESAVIGVSDEVKGSIIKAFVVLNRGFEGNENLKQELSIFVKQNYAGHSYPKIIEFIKELPKTNSGKIIRMKLKEKQND